MTFENKQKLASKLEKDYKEYTNACILYAETRENYEPLSWDRDCVWLKNWIIENL